MSELNNWSRRRRASHEAQTNIDIALAICARHLRVGAVTNAARAAALAQRLMHLDTMQAERCRRQEIKAAMERQRAEVALKEARKAVASLAAPAAPRAEYDVLCPDEDWPETLKRMLADAEAQRMSGNAAIDSQPVQIPPPDSC